MLYIIQKNKLRCFEHRLSSIELLRKALLHVFITGCTSIKNFTAGIGGDIIRNGGVLKSLGSILIPRVVSVVGSSSRLKQSTKIEMSFIEIGD
jgi:hypothetical protein